MDIEQLTYFLNIAKAKSINAVSQNYYITPQALNAQIKKLETELDTLLLKRTNRGVSLTPEGHLFVPHAQKLLQDYYTAISELENFKTINSSLQGTLTIFTASIFTNFLTKIIKDFIKIYPKTNIKIIEVESNELISYLSEHYCDIALFSASESYIQKKISECTNIHTISLVKDKVVLCMRPDHPLMNYKYLDEKKQIAYISKSKETFRFSIYQALTEKSEATYDSAITSSSNIELHKKLIEEEIAITYMPNLAYQYEFKKEGFAALPINDSYSINHCLLYRDDNPDEEMIQLIRTFSEFLLKKFKKRNSFI